MIWRISLSKIKVGHQHHITHTKFPQCDCLLFHRSVGERFVFHWVAGMDDAVGQRPDAHHHLLHLLQCGCVHATDVRRSQSAAHFHHPNAHKQSCDGDQSQPNPAITNTAGPTNADTTTSSGGDVMATTGNRMIRTAGTIRHNGGRA